MPATSLINSHVTDLDFASREEERFNNFYEDILSLHELLDQIQNISLRRQFRDIINKVEDDFSNDVDFTTPRCCQYNTLRLGVIGGSLSGKSSLIQRYITGTNPKEDVMPGKHKKTVTIRGQSNLLLIRDETGPPDYFFSLWADAVVLVFSLSDEHSFNVISSYYAKMITYRNENTNLLPCILVGIKDDSIINDNLSDGGGNHPGVAETRVKKFISDHRKCPYFEVSLETGENVNEVFQTGAEKISILQNLTPGGGTSHDQLMSASFTSLNTLDSERGLGSSFNGSHSSFKKNKRRNTLFSLNAEKKEKLKEKEKEKEKEKDVTYDDIGSGRSIPIKQGNLYKRSSGSLKEWKKKFVVITDDQTFQYYPSMKNYMEDEHVKAFKLIHTTVKTPGKRGSKPSQSTPHKGHRRSLSTNNLLIPSPSKTPVPPETNQSSECFVISNNIANDTTDGGLVNMSNGSPTIHHDIPIGRTSSDGKDHGTSNNRATLSQDTYPIKKKYKHRNKSCELDYHPDTGGEVHSDVDGLLFSPATPVIKKKTHRRQKSFAASKESGLDGRATDTEDSDNQFTLVYYDGRTCDFECPTMEDRDAWVSAIETQILKAFELQKSKTDLTSNSKNENEVIPNSPCISDLLKSIPGNDQCADCGSKDAEWASLNLGILICIECCGVHRNLGSHLSRVRSVMLDDWPPETIRTMKSLGNKVANQIWEANLNSRQKITPTASREERDLWIASKYEKKEFLDSVPNNTSQELFNLVENEDVAGCYRLLISSTGKDVNQLTPWGGEGGKIQISPLHLSCLKGNAPITQLLLWYRADARLLDSEHFKPIHYAYKSKDKLVIDLLSQYAGPEDTPC
ncbi:arf-GAP with GTPase, ANK repeat and PH domain-containing protein 1-like [Clytia hemisphaerica]|uniref:Uncharacterized protein n=1 Tax=Clytia hemisphaerica TaxID=252671 RepID=A0A7M5VD33_9CNID